MPCRSAMHTRVEAILQMQSAPCGRQEQSVVLLIFHDCTRKLMPSGVKKGVSKRKYVRTVEKIKRKGGAKNPHAVANAKLGRKGKSKASKSRSK